MTSEKWQKLKEICNLALEREPDERHSFLALICSGDEDLRRYAESMIARATSGGGILEGPIWKDLGIEADIAECLSGQFIPKRIGRYQILRVIGEGGMGVVYEAEQDQPRRRVALKVIRPGLTSPQILRRFDRESQALARLHHVGIAQIYEAGTAETSHGPQPYFAMEFIQGTPLGEYANTHHLRARERLELMAEICEAVEHAHQKGIIHRDLKPGNILVDETGQPKVLDFGVARVTDSDAQLTKQTDIGQLLGTLAYMSPEQVTGDAKGVDTRSDVYALGVILYELLAQRLPYQVSDDLYDAVRTIREEDPKRLSSINRVFHGDVETIVAKALEKDKMRRYASAAAMKGDIRRYLLDQPIAARPASTVYQLQKFARRHKALVAAAVIVFVVLVAGVIVSTMQAVKARRAEQISEAVNNFLQNDLLAQASSNNQSTSNTTPDPDLKVRTALDRAAARISGKFERQPEVEAAIRDTIGQTYMDIGLYAEARGQLERALDMRRRVLGTQDPKTLATISRLGRNAYLESNYSQSEALYRQALEGQQRVLGLSNPDTIDSINGLAIAYKEEGKYGEAEKLLQQMLDVSRRTLGAADRRTLQSIHNLALIYHAEGKYLQAEELYVQTLAAKRNVLGPEHPSTLLSMHSLAHIYELLGKYEQAEVLHTQLVEIRRRILGPEHPDTLDSAGDLANIYYLEGKYVQAEALQSEVLDVQRRILGAENSDTLESSNVLAGILVARGKYAQAEALYRYNLEISRRTLGPQHEVTLNFVQDFASLCLRENKYALAENLATQALDGRRHTQGAEHPQTITAEGELALVYLSQGKIAKSESLAREALETAKKVQPDNWRRYYAASLLGAALAGEKRYAEAEPLLLEGFQGMLSHKDKMSSPDRYYLDRAQEWLVHLYLAWGKSDEAVRWRQHSSRNR